ncbi:MAG: DUF1566 domain-containing protein [Thermodesulfobacteriota bacterium]
MPGGLLATGQTLCYDEHGAVTPCPGSGQDGEFRHGRPWPSPRFVPEGAIVADLLTGLIWSRDANPLEFPLTWPEALAAVQQLNGDGYGGFADWRLPNRRELRSLLSMAAKKPALPDGHPFQNVFLGWYWTSTTAAINPAYAWYVHMEGARMFYGRKDQYSLVWPVRGGGEGILPATGQTRCFDAAGREIDCAGTAQDGEFRRGRTLPARRFAVEGEWVRDLFTGLVWYKKASLTAAPVNWQGALAAVEAFNSTPAAGGILWRLPNINELESLVDCARHAPALPPNHPFVEVQEVYWSSTTSFFETDWAWALYMHKGATGVGHKLDAGFHLWTVSGVPS